MDLTDTSLPIEEDTNKLPQTCPSWVKITEIPHPALVPGFISRRECLPDGSFDPNTPSVPLQMSLLQSSGLSPSLVSVISNIPSGLMCESIYKKNLREAKEEGDDGEGFLVTLPPSHYKRTADPLLLPSNLNPLNSNVSNSGASVALANQTASELAALNILYGGVKGKAYLDSLRSFSEGVSAAEGSKIEGLLREKVEKSESVCGFKVFGYRGHQELDLELENIFSLPILEQNNQILHLLNMPTLKEETRRQLLDKLKENLIGLVKECPEEIKSEKFKGVTVEGII